MMINFDGKKITSNDFKNEIKDLYSTFDEDRNKNFSKFFNFCQRIKQGILIWKWREPYQECYCGFYSEKMSFFGTIARRITYMRTCSTYGSEKISIDGIGGNLPSDCNFQIYYLPESEMDLIKNIYDNLSQYYQYEEFIKNMNPVMKNIIKYRNLEMEDEEIDDYIDKYFNEKITSYQHIVIN